VCPLAAKIKRGILLSSKYPLNILVADDNKMILQVMKKSLATLGYQNVKTVENGQQAIDELKSTPYDVILMDMQMPVLDGCEAAQQIRKTHNIPCHIIALTANAFTEDRERCITAGMCSYMSKPVRMDVLKQELKLAFKELHSEFSTCICKMTGGASPHPAKPAQPGSEPTPSEPAPSEPATSEPAVSKSAASEPAVAKPAASEPAASKSAVSEPTASKSAVSEPAASKSAVSEPDSKPTELTDPADPAQSM